VSAIGALVRARDEPVSLGDLERMGATLSSFGGPASFWLGAPVGLLHRGDGLLAEDILEPQPLTGAAGRFVLVFDGRLDTRREIAEALEINEGVSRDLSDAGLVLRAWEEWGEDALPRLVGSYAFALWDVPERTLHAATSPSDARTLFYRCDSGGLALATMPRALFVLPGPTRTVDPVKIADYLLDIQDPSRSFWKGVSALPPGHLLRFRDGAVEVRRFRGASTGAVLRFARDDEYAEALLALLDRVVHNQLRSVSAVGVSLSGGLDSASVAASAARALARERGRLLAFTEVPRSGFSGPVPEGRYADETPLVSAIARLHPNIDLTFVRTEGGTFLDGLEESFAHREAPFRNAFNRPWLLAVNEEARRRGARAVLTGTGGNATVSWHGLSLFPNLLQRFRWLRALREARALAGGAGLAGTARALVGHGVLPLLPVRARAFVRRVRHVAMHGRSPAWTEWSLARPELLAEARLEERALERSLGPLDRSLLSPHEGRMWLLGLGSGGSFEAGCRSQHDVDLRNPLFDVRLADFCLALPDDQCLRNGLSRALVRRAMKGRLPEEVLENRRRGLQASDWVESLRAARPLLRERLGAFRRHALLPSVLDLPRLERLVDGPAAADTGDPAVVSVHCGALGRAVTIGSFVLWSEQRAREESTA
jgi:asparagine synthase (glutamine-hydrolysing)